MKELKNRGRQRWRDYICLFVDCRNSSDINRIKVSYTTQTLWEME